MAGGFMGLGDMSREDQMRVGLTAILVLSLECVLEGLVAEAPLRSWVFHAVAVGFVGWSLLDLSPWIIRSASTAGVVAVGNEALLISEADASMRFLIPSAVLFAASGWVFQRSIATSVSPDAYSPPLTNPLTAPQMLGFDLPPMPPRINQLQKVSPAVIGVGSLISLYGMFGASWAQTDTLFGLFQDQLTLSEVRSAWGDLGVPDGVLELAASGVQILGILALLVSAIGAVGAVSRQFVMPRQLSIGGVAFIGVVLVLQLLTISGVSSAEADVRVLAGAWLAPLGLATAGVGYWLSRDAQ